MVTPRRSHQILASLLVFHTRREGSIPSGTTWCPPCSGEGRGGRPRGWTAFDEGGPHADPLRTRVRLPASPPGHRLIWHAACFGSRRLEVQILLPRRTRGRFKWMTAHPPYRWAAHNSTSLCGEWHAKTMPWTPRPPLLASIPFSELSPGSETGMSRRSPKPQEEVRILPGMLDG